MHPLNFIHALQAAAESAHAPLPVLRLRTAPRAVRSQRQLRKDRRRAQAAGLLVRF